MKGIADCQLIAKWCPRVQICGKSAIGGGNKKMAKKITGYIKLQVPAGKGESGAADRSGAGPARREHHGVLQGFQRQDRADGSGSERSRS
jgi:hypothetical protein